MADTTGDLRVIFRAINPCANVTSACYEWIHDHLNEPVEVAYVHYDGSGRLELFGFWTELRAIHYVNPESVNGRVYYELVGNLQTTNVDRDIVLCKDCAHNYENVKVPEYSDQCRSFFPHSTCSRGVAKEVNDDGNDRSGRSDLHNVQD